MSAFEYVTVLISVILGLGITQILTGIANLFQWNDRVSLYWPYVLWVIFVLVMHIQEWWVTYELKDYHPWRLPIFFFIMLYPVNLFILAKLLLPTATKGKSINLKEFYFKNYRRIFLVTIVSAILSVFYNIFILNLHVQSQAFQLLLILALSIMAGKRLQQEWIHKLLSVALILSFAVSTIIEWNVWLIE